MIKQYFVFFCVFFSFFSMPTHGDCPGIYIKGDRVTLNSSGTPPLNDNRITVFFKQTYSVPPLVFLLPHNLNTNATTVSVLSVTTTSFDVGVSEAPINGVSNGSIDPEKINYFAVEPGHYQLAPNIELEAGIRSVSSDLARTNNSSLYETESYAQAFSSTLAVPLLFSEIQSTNNNPGFLYSPNVTETPWVESATYQSGSTRSNFLMGIERAETNQGASGTAGQVAESVAYLAMTPGTATITDALGNNIDISVLKSPDNVTGDCTNVAHGLTSTPIVISNKSERDGADGGWVRLCNTSATNVSLQIEEDRTLDSEQSHTPEEVNIFAFSQPFSLNQTGLPKLEIGDALLTPANNTAQLNFTQVSFPNAFTETPLIFAVPTMQEADPASLRIRNVSTTGFQIAQMTPEGSLAPANSMDIDYLAVIPGIHEFPNNVLEIEAGLLNTNRQQGKFVTSTWDSSLSFSNTYGAAPSLLLDIQTTNSESGIDPDVNSSPWLETAAQGISPTGADFALERVKTSTGFVSSEAVAYVAVEHNQSSTFIANGGTPVTFKSWRTPASVNSIADLATCSSFAFPGGAFSAGTTPYVVANNATRAGGDGSWARHCKSLTTNSQVRLTIDEDTSDGSNRSHGADESLSVMAWDNAFEWCPPKLSLQKTVSILEDPINGGTNPKAIPGAITRYAIKSNNEGRVPITNDSIVIGDNIKNDQRLYIGTSAPYAFALIDGTGSNQSGLNFSYIGASNTSDDVEFSAFSSGTNWTHIPLDTDGDGFEDSPLTQRVRFNPKGSFLGSVSGSTPTFTLGFSTKVSSP